MRALVFDVIKSKTSESNVQSAPKQTESATRITAFESVRAQQNIVDEYSECVEQGRPNAENSVAGADGIKKSEKRSPLDPYYLRN